jgi:hypothetical protein
VPQVSAASESLGSSSSKRQARKKEEQSDQSCALLVPPQGWEEAGEGERNEGGQDRDGHAVGAAVGVVYLLELEFVQ